MTSYLEPEARSCDGGGPPCRSGCGSARAERDAFLAGLKEKRRFYGGETYEKSRSDAQIEGFRYALHETMDLWYAHQGTTVYLVTAGVDRVKGLDYGSYY